MIRAAISASDDPGPAERGGAPSVPLGHAHVNELGRYAFLELASGAALRPLRDPHADDQQA
jgi:hypothetical protein